jgi:hypothetical protein
MIFEKSIDSENQEKKESCAKLFGVTRVNKMADILLNEVQQ